MFIIYYLKKLRLGEELILKLVLLFLFLIFRFLWRYDNNGVFLFICIFNICFKYFKNNILFVDIKSRLIFVKRFD